MAGTISIGIPAIKPSVSMWVYRNLSQNGSNVRIMSKAVTAVGVRQPSIATRPPRESSANISAALGNLSAKARACSWLMRPSLNNADQRPGGVLLNHCVHRNPLAIGHSATVAFFNALRTPRTDDTTDFLTLTITTTR